MNESNITAAKSIIGEKVRNTEGKDLGSIKEILIDATTGKIEYGVLSFGGILGLGDKDVAVPYEALMLNRAQDYFILNVDKEVLDNTNSKIEYDGKSYYIY